MALWSSLEEKYSILCLKEEPLCLMKHKGYQPLLPYCGRKGFQWNFEKPRIFLLKKANFDSDVFFLFCTTEVSNILVL